MDTSMLYMFDDLCSITNYTDDNTLKYAHQNVTIVMEVLEDGTNKAISWYNENDMKANPSKLQGLIMSNDPSITSFSIPDFEIPVEDY